MSEHTVTRSDQEAMMIGNLCRMHAWQLNTGGRYRSGTAGHRPAMKYMVQKRPYRESDAWYWVVVDRRNGLSTLRRFPTRESAEAMCSKLNGV
jgi:hypothetical protein